MTAEADVPPGPVAPMLARLVRTLPRGGLLYEPKWDGFRCIAVRDSGHVELWSRHGRPFTRYFPELVAALEALPADGWTMDGEILVERDGEFDFAALLSRLHPAASRVARLAVETPATLMAFDIVREAREDLTSFGFAERRVRLETLLTDAPPPVRITAITDDERLAAMWLDAFAVPGSGMDGVVAKRPDLRYEPGRRSMLKVKLERTADCVVAGFRWLADQRAIGSLLLGLFSDRGELRHVGVVSSFTEEGRERILAELSPLATPLDDHPWAKGFLISPSPLGRLKGAAGRWTPDMAFDWVPLRLERVAEVAYDRFDGDRFRHPARWVRWRPDRDPRSCTFDQLWATEAPEAASEHG
jgi:ATP-dependent DNA ligase